VKAIQSHLSDSLPDFSYLHSSHHNTLCQFAADRPTPIIHNRLGYPLLWTELAAHPSPEQTTLPSAIAFQ
jgi:hypothetical protein